MKGWAVVAAIVAVVVASGIGLWVTWDTTRTSATQTDQVPADLVPTTTFPLVAGATTTTALQECALAPGAQVGGVVGDPQVNWDRVVIDPSHSLAPDFAPDDLVSVSLAGFPSRDQVRSIVIPDLAALRAAAEANGTPLVVVSGYRSYSYQEDLFADRVEEVGEAEATRRTARPGHSEHQLGTALDVLDPGTSDLTTAFGATPQGQWLAANAHTYGFVISYPDGAADRTCYEYEPWHLRYVGPSTAAAIRNAGLTPREWMLANPAETLQRVAR
jgi:zinc D-Ala-D-Ala carboxypeptidase